MLVHSGVLFTLITAGLARGPAGLKDGTREVRVVSGVAGKHVAGGSADVSAVQVGTDALGQFGNHVLAEAGIGAGGAGLGTFEARLDTLCELFLVYASQVLGVSVEHGRYTVCHWFLLINMGLTHVSRWCEFVVKNQGCYWVAAPKSIRWDRLNGHRERLAREEGLYV